MKRFLTCALCFVSLPVFADVTLYYDINGVCPYLQIAPNCTGDPVTQLEYTTRFDARFSGYKIGNVEIVDSNGNIASNAVDTLIAAQQSGTISNSGEIPGNYECGTGMEKNQYDVCVPNKGGVDGDTYTDGDGVEHTLDEIDCDYLNTTGTQNKDFCKRTVVVRLHDKPDGVDLHVTNGNEGRVLWCNRVWCYEPYWAQSDGNNGIVYNNGGGSLVESINMPHVDGYKFRGYFYRDSKNMDDLIVDKTYRSDPKDVAAGQFYPKNNSDTTTIMSVYAPTDGINIWYDPNDSSTSISGLPIITEGPLKGMHEIDIYGGWARECDPGDNATCILQKGISVAHASNGLKPGQVRYIDGCDNGYHLEESSTDVYNPNCVADSGNIEIDYTFIDQYNKTVQCGQSVTQTCATGSTYNLLNTTGFNNACGAGYTLRWLRKDTKWYSPGRGVLCVTNVFGQDEQSTLMGYVCRECIAPENGYCTDVSPDTTIHYNASDNMYYSGNLWGENTGTINTEVCQWVQCNEGYTRTITESNGTIKCLTPYEACVYGCSLDPSKCDNNPEQFCNSGTAR